MGRLQLDGRSFDIADAVLINLQTALVHALQSEGRVALVLHDRDGEEHIVIAAARPIVMRMDSETVPSADVVERLLDELAVLGSISVVCGRAPEQGRAVQ